jgi:ankyrin repeat protein
MSLKIIAVFLISLFAVASGWAGPNEDEALREAAMQLNLAGVKAAIQKKANPNAASSDQRPTTPLGAVTMGMLLSQDADANKRALEITKFLFSSGAKLGPFDKNILFFPISNGHGQLVALLLEHGASPTARLDGFTPTELALKYDQKPIYDLLVSRGGPPVKKSTAAQIALAEAAATADIHRMNEALKNGARIDGLDSDGRTALINSVRRPIYEHSQAETVQWILDHGADPNFQGESGFTGLEGIPLHIFVFMNKLTMKGGGKKPEAKALAEKTLHQLLKAGAKVSGMDSQGRTPLHQAAKADNVSAAEILIQEGARVMAKDKTGKTPLDYAESASMIRLLKEHGATETR